MKSLTYKELYELEDNTDSSFIDSAWYDYVHEHIGHGGDCMELCERYHGTAMYDEFLMEYFDIDNVVTNKG